MSESRPLHRDPLESFPRATLLFGGVFLIVAVIKLVLRILTGSVGAAIDDGHDDFFRVFGFLLGFAVIAGLTVSFARRRMGSQRTCRSKNFVTGGLVAICYALGCTLFFSAGMAPLAKLGLATAVGVSVWYAVASGLNEVFAKGGA